MPILIAGAVIALILLFMYVRAAKGETYIEILAGIPRVRRGSLNAAALAAMADILRESRVPAGYVTISQDNRVAFSWHVPPALHQQLRNVLLRDRALALPRRRRG